MHPRVGLVTDLVVASLGDALKLIIYWSHYCLYVSVLFLA